MKLMVFRPRFCTCKTILGQGQPGLMRLLLLWIMPVRDRSTCWLVLVVQRANTVPRMPLPPPYSPLNMNTWYCCITSPYCYLSQNGFPWAWVWNWLPLRLAWRLWSQWLSSYCCSKLTGWEVGLHWWLSSHSRASQVEQYLSMYSTWKL